VQDDIARAITSRLKVTLKAGQHASVKVGTSNLEAYQLYSKGRALLSRGGLDTRPAAKCFERAVALDPQYGLAWPGLADARNTLGYSGFDRPEATMPQAKEAATRAVALDPMLAETHCSLACSYLLHDWNRREAEREFLRALELNPRYIQNLTRYAWLYLASEGRFDEGIVLMKRAIEYDPLSASAHATLAHLCGHAGRSSEAVRAAKSATELEESFVSYFALSMACRIDRQFEEALAAGEMALALSGRHVLAMATQSMIFADWGRNSAAQAIYQELVARARQGYVQPTALAISACAAGDSDKAFEHLREAYEIRDPGLAAGAWRNVHCVGLSKDPRCEEILVRMGLK